MGTGGEIELTVTFGPSSSILLRRAIAYASRHANAAAEVSPGTWRAAFALGTNPDPFAHAHRLLTLVGTGRRRRSRWGDLSSQSSRRSRWPRARGSGSGESAPAGRPSRLGRGRSASSARFTTRAGPPSPTPLLRISKEGWTPRRTTRLGSEASLDRRRPPRCAPVVLPASEEDRVPVCLLAP